MAQYSLTPLYILDPNTLCEIYDCELLLGDRDEKCATMARIVQRWNPTSEANI